MRKYDRRAELNMRFHSYSMSEYMFKLTVTGLQV